MGRQFSVQWMLKHIKEKLIHLLGGYTKQEYEHYGNIRQINGARANNQINKDYLERIEYIAYGKSKQEWIDLIHNAIKHL